MKPRCCLVRDQRVGRRDLRRTSYWLPQLDVTVKSLRKNVCNSWLSLFGEKVGPVQLWPPRLRWTCRERKCNILNEKCDVCLNGLKMLRFFVVLYSLFFMDTSEVLAPGECALVSLLLQIYCLNWFLMTTKLLLTFCALAFALKGVEYDQVAVNLIKDGGQQVQFAFTGLINIFFINYLETWLKALNRVWDQQWMSIC